MTVPDPLPARFTATLAARVRALFAHGILDDGRQLVDVPGDGDALSVRVCVDREAGTVRLLSFPTVEDEVGTAIGRVGAAVTVEGEPEGTYADDSGHVEIEVSLHLDAKSLFARDSDVRLSLASDAAVDQPELSAEGDPFDAGDATVRLVGRGTLEGGSLDGGTLWLVLGGTVTALEETG